MRKKKKKKTKKKKKKDGKHKTGGQMIIHADNKNRLTGGHC